MPAIKVSHMQVRALPPLSRSGEQRARSSRCPANRAEQSDQYRVLRFQENSYHSLFTFERRHRRDSSTRKRLNRAYYLSFHQLVIIIAVFRGENNLLNFWIFCYVWWKNKYWICGGNIGVILSPKILTSQNSKVLIPSDLGTGPARPIGFFFSFCMDDSMVTAK